VIVKKWNERIASAKKKKGGITLLEKFANQFGHSDTNGLDLFLIPKMQV